MQFASLAKKRKSVSFFGLCPKKETPPHYFASEASKKSLIGLLQEIELKLNNHDQAIHS
jgi:hypothetical protein